MTFSSERSRPPHLRHLRYADVAPGRAYHAALIAVDGARARGFQVSDHTHDFYELMGILAGEAAHVVNGASAPLRAGDLILLTPGDWHSVRFLPGRLLHYVNIALPAVLWEGFRSLTGTATTLGSVPVARALSAPSASECAAAFHRALEGFEAGAEVSGLEACRLLAAVVPCLLAPERGGIPDDGFLRDAPPWLIRACRRLRQDPDLLRSGLPGFVAAAGVTPTHLARVLKAAARQTPTQYVNALRLDRAARLLTTTTLPVLDVAGECGFEQPSYFYRRFRAHFGTTPQAYRSAAGRRIAPEDSQDAIASRAPARTE
ncbi:MAG: AraC family transcriptional regulator [Cytophagales bacterium]|nr:AraC family transcriptional regulator [Armatimonadota bacterium]